MAGNRFTPPVGLLAMWLIATTPCGNPAHGGPPPSPAAGESAQARPSSEPATREPASNEPTKTVGEASRPRREAEWKLESLRLRDGQVLRGLILTDRPEAIEFVEIRRPPGQPMHAVLRVPDPRSVVDRQRLEGSERLQLLERYESFKHRVRIELGRMEQLELNEIEQEGVGFHAYEGRWFRLLSTADPEMTRRCVVRVEQIVRAYRQLFPPRADAPRRFQLILYGSMDEYRGHLQRLGLELDNPAFYSAPRNLIVAGSNLSRYSERLQQIRGENAAILRRYDQVLNPQFDRSLLELGRQLKQQGGNLEEIALRRANWDGQYKAVQRRIDETNRRNEAKFAEVTQQMFARLYHETFHAYLENYVYPHRDHDTPRWLNEGLAQVFESGQLEADTLRIDAPDHDRLLQLQAFLRRQPRPLAGLLASEFAGRTAGKTAGRATAGHADYSEQDYLLAWGLAHFLAYDVDLLDQPTLDWYVSPDAARLDAIARFEKLVRMPLSQFEVRWRLAILERTDAGGNTTRTRP